MTLIVGYLSLLASAACGIAERSQQDPAPHDTTTRGAGGNASHQNATSGDGGAGGTGNGGSGGQKASSTAQAGAGGAEAPSEREVDSFCSSLEQSDDRVVVVGRHHASLGFLRANGQITITPPLVTGSLPTLSISPNRAYAVIYSLEFASDGVHLDLALYEFATGLLWSHQLAGEGLLPPSVADDGRVTVSARENQLTIELDGELVSAPHAPTANAAPDADGWLLAELEPPAGGTGTVPGFRNVETGEQRHLSYTDLSNGQFPLPIDSAYYYFANVDGNLVLVRETATSLDLIETSLPTSEQQSFAVEGDWFWIYLSRVPVWRYSPTEDHAETIPYLEPAGDEVFTTHLSGDFALVTERGGPRYSVNLSTLELVEHPPFGEFDAWQVLSAGPWFLGSGPDGPYFRVNAETGSSERIDLSQVLAGHTVWPVAACGDALQSRAISIRLLEDGNFGLALRDDIRAGYYLAAFDLGEWTQLGGSFADVQEIQAYQHGPTWLVAGSYTDGEDLFCPFVGDSPFLPGDDPEALLRGNSFQIVPPNPDHIVSLDGHPYPAHFHESGLCVAKDERLYDLQQGTSVDLGFQAEHWFTSND